MVRGWRAASGQAALDTLSQIKGRDEPVALLLSDQRMPGITGVEFLERSREFYPDARRVLLTAYADTEAAIYLKDSNTLYEEINPGNSLKGTLLFDVPKGIKPAKLELHDSAFSGGVDVRL